MVHKRAYIDLPWHDPSDQPYAVSDRRLQRRLRREAVADYLRQAGTIALSGGFAAGHYLRLPRRDARWVGGDRPYRDLVGLSLDPAAAPVAVQQELIEELDVGHLLARIGVWQPERLDACRQLVEALPEREWAVCVMQDRLAVHDHVHWRRCLWRIVSRLWPQVQTFQIGQAVNRGKWGCFQIGEFFPLGLISQDLRRDFPGIKLVAPSLLDFEPLQHLRLYCHHQPMRFDIASSALYVDRRGSPRDTQYGTFDLVNKIRAIAACIATGRRCPRRLWITETNWPLADVGEASPAKDHQVDEDTYAGYMLQYLEDARATGLVERVYWWQLIAHGYGLVEDAEHGYRRRPAFHELRMLLHGK